MPAKTRQQRERELETFRRGCRQAIEACDQPCCEEERREAAQGLGRERYLPDPQDDLPLGAA